MGAAVLVWQDYVAGTDPTNAQSKFTAKIKMKDVDNLCGSYGIRQFIMSG